MNALQTHFYQFQSIVDKQISLQCTHFVLEAESQEYGACSFNLAQYFIRFRVARVTPKKAGQFVTLWKRIDSGPIMPFDLSDQLDFFIVSVQKGHRYGLFIFPQVILIAKDIFSNNGQGGKRAIRVYPSWDTADSKQAQVTQMWQLRYFIEIQTDGSCDQEILHKLLFID